MTCPYAVPIPHFKKCLAIFVLCLMTSTQQAQANKAQVVFLAATSAIVFTLGMLGFYHEYNDNTESFDDSMKLLPKITYKVDHSVSHQNGATKVTLKPRIIRGQYLKPGRWDRTVKWFTARAICDPISMINDTSLDLASMTEQCHAWFKAQTMRFPHEALGVTIDQLDTLLLPKLVVDLNSKKLELKVARTSFVDDQNKPSSVNSKTTRGEGVDWPVLSPSFNELNALTDIATHPFELCHHAPEKARMQEPDPDANGLTFYQFPVPGISHLHRTGLEFYIVSLKRGNGFTGYFWKDDAPWPDGYQLLKFDRKTSGTPTTKH